MNTFTKPATPNGLHLAISAHGLNWSPLNQNSPSWRRR
jgi:hypothetical protein